MKIKGKDHGLLEVSLPSTLELHQYMKKSKIEGEFIRTDEFYLINCVDFLVDFQETESFQQDTGRFSRKFRFFISIS